MWAVAEGFNDASHAALGASQRRRSANVPRQSKLWRGHRTGEMQAQDQELDALEAEVGSSKASVRTVIVLFLSGVLFLLYWRQLLSPQLAYLEKQRGHWLFPVKEALDAAACPECFDGSIMLPVLLAFYFWGRIITRVLGFALALGCCALVGYGPYLCWDHRLPAQYDYKGICRSNRPQCQAAIDYRDREGLDVGSDGQYAYMWKLGTAGSLTQPEINHAKTARDWQHLVMKKDMVSSSQGRRKASCRKHHLFCPLA